MSVPSSSSRCISGFKFRLPSVVRTRMPPSPMVKLSYCALKRGEPPAVPYEARNLRSLIGERRHQGSCEARQAIDTRPNVASLERHRRWLAALQCAEREL